MSSFAALIFSCVALATSLLLPTMFKDREVPAFVDGGSLNVHRSTRNLKMIWASSLAFSAVLMLSTLLVDGFIATLVLISLNGTAWAVTSWVPFALVGKYVALDMAGLDDADLCFEKVKSHDTQAGSIVGLHNAAISAPQIIASLICELVVLASHVDEHGRVAGWVLRVGGFGFLAAACLAGRSDL